MDSIPRTSGIYQIRCTPTGKVYVGSAINLRRRIQEHKSALRRGIHKNPHLQNAWKKYGATSFEFSVLELVLSAFVTDREQYWINHLHACDRRKGFNAAPIAGSNAGCTRSEETRAKIAATLRGRVAGPYSDEHRRNISEAKRGTKYKPHSVEARRAKSERQKGRVLSQETRDKIGARHRNKAPSATVRAACIAANQKSWVVIDPDGKEYAILNLNRFCLEHGLTATSMGNVASGKQRHHKGWTCRRA